MATSEVSTRSRTIRRWRLWILLVINAAVLAAYTYSQLFPPPPIEPISPGGTRLVADVRALGGKTNLELLQLRFLLMSASGLEHLKTLPKLRQVSLYQCGLLDEDVAEFRDAMPDLTIETPK
jgi:hypothetical protein